MTLQEWFESEYNTEAWRYDARAITQDNYIPMLNLIDSDLNSWILMLESTCISSDTVLEDGMAITAAYDGVYTE